MNNNVKYGLLWHANVFYRLLLRGVFHSQQQQHLLLFVFICPINLAWDWGYCNTKEAHGEQTQDEVREWDRKVKESLMKYQQAISRKTTPPNQYISILQAELINFLIQQIKQKNKKLVSLIQQISELGNIVECDVEVGNRVIIC